MKRLFTQDGEDRVRLLSRRTRYDMGRADRRLFGTKNLSRYWRSEIRTKATRLNNFGLVKKYVGPTRSENRVASGIWIEYWCKGKRIPGS